MPTDNKDAQNEIFDIILAEALKEDCVEKIAKYKEIGSEYVFSEKFEKGIESIKRQFRREQRIGKFKKAAPKLATAAAIIIMCAAIATNPAVGAFVRNIIAQITDGFNRYEFIDEEITAENFNHEIRPLYIAEGFRLTYVYYGLISVTLDYMDDDGEIITIVYGIANDSSIYFDNEHSKTYKTIVNGKEAIFHKSTDENFQNSLVWTSGGYDFVIYAHIEMEEFVQIAESIKNS